MSQLRHREGNTRCKMAQEQLAETGFEPACVWHQVHVFNHCRIPPDRKRKVRRESQIRKKVNAVLQILFEMTSYSKIMSKRSLFWTSYYLILLSIFERKQCLKLDMKNKHNATSFSRIKWQLTPSWVEERQGISGEELKTFVKNKTYI